MTIFLPVWLIHTLIGMGILIVSIPIIFFAFLGFCLWLESRHIHNSWGWW